MKRSAPEMCFLQLHLGVSALASPGNGASPRWLADFSCQNGVGEQRAGTGKCPEREGRNEIVSHQLRTRDAGWVEPRGIAQ